MVTENITDQFSNVTFSTVGKKILFFSAYLVNYIAFLFEKIGLPLSRTQIQIAMAIIDLIAILLVLRFVAKPAIKIVLFLLLVWLIIGFFVPI